MTPFCILNLLPVLCFAYGLVATSGMGQYWVSLFASTSSPAAGAGSGELHECRKVACGRCTGLPDPVPVRGQERCLYRREGGREGGVSVAPFFLSPLPFEPFLLAQGTSNHWQEIFSPTLSGQHGREKIPSGYRISGGAHSNQESC